MFSCCMKDRILWAFRNKAGTLSQALQSRTLNHKMHFVTRVMPAHHIGPVCPSHITAPAQIHWEALASRPKQKQLPHGSV